MLGSECLLEEVPPRVTVSLQLLHYHCCPVPYGTIAIAVAFQGVRPCAMALTPLSGLDGGMQSLLQEGGGNAAGSLGGLGSLFQLLPLRAVLSIS